MNWAHDNLGQVSSGKRFWQDGMLVASPELEYAFDDSGNRKTAGRGGDHACVLNSGTDTVRLSRHSSGTGDFVRALQQDRNTRQ